MKAKKLNRKVVTLAKFGSKNMNAAASASSIIKTDPTTSTVTVTTTY